MSRKPFKRFERWVLIGVVVLLIATFSVTGVTARGCGRGDTGPEKFGGTFEVAPGKLRTVTDEDFRRVNRRYGFLYGTLIGPSLLFRGEMTREDRGRREVGSWMHLVHVAVAEEAGYRVSDEEVRAAVRDLLSGLGRRGGGFTVEAYNEFLTQLSRVSQRGHDPVTKAEFESTIREYLLKDKLLGDIVATDRYAVDREAAYNAWKSSREQVDLAFAALSGAHFVDSIRLDEATRASISSLLTSLGKVSDAVREVRTANAILATWRANHGGNWPEDEADLLAKDPGTRLAQTGRDPSEGRRLLKDSWGFPLAYLRTADGARIVSAGADGEAGTSDDVTPDLTSVLDGLATLRRTADAIQNWHRDTGAWPASIEDLLKPAPAKEGRPAAPALLIEVPKDPWGRALEFSADPVQLRSAGPDGRSGSEDDLVALAGDAEGSLLVALPIQVRPWIPESVNTDAWGRSMRVSFAAGGRFEVSSAGANGVYGDEDDVRDGNQADLEAYYATVKKDFALPRKREFEAVYVVPSLVSDEIFAKAWSSLPQFRPEEREAWDAFRAMLGEGYVIAEGDTATGPPIDPADPVKGYAAALRRDLAEKGVIPAEAKGFPVPAPETLGDRAEPPASGTPGLPDPDADPLYKTYVTRGWRRVLLRDQFFAKLLDAMLRTGREAEERVRAWHDSGKQGVEPKVDSAQFDAQLAQWQELQPGAAEMAAGVRSLVYYRTPEPLDRTALEALPVLGDPQLFSYIDSAKDGMYDVVPRALHGGPALLALRTIKRHPERDAELAEVRDTPAFQTGYLDARAVERAARELQRVRASLLPAPTDPRNDGAGPPAASGPAQVEAFEKAFAAAAAERKLPIVVDRTGLFVGSSGRVMRTPVPPADAPEAVKEAMARRAFVRAKGYETVRETESTRSSSVGSLGRWVLPDRDPEAGRTPTRTAYLVIVAAQVDPVKEAFHGRAFVEWVRHASYDRNPEGGGQRANLADRKGRVLRLLYGLYDDWDRVKADYKIRTNEDLLLPKNAGTAR